MDETKVGISKQKCIECEGSGVWMGSSGQQACKRCGGSGKEISNKNRNNRARGHANERRLAKLLKAWWDPTGESEWVRTPQSGGSKLKEGWDLAGDIATNAKDWVFHCECKKEKSWQLEQLLTAPETNRIVDYLAQVDKDCPDHKTPAVFLSKPGNNCDIVVLYRKLVEDMVGLNLLKPSEFMLIGNIAIVTLKVLISIPPEAIKRLFDGRRDKYR